MAAASAPPRRRCAFSAARVYLATVVTLISAMMLGDHAGPPGASVGRAGIDRRTLARWRAWWRSTFTDSPFAPVAMAAFVPPVDIAGLPASLLERFAGDIREQLDRLAALPRAADRRRIGDARFLTDAADPQRMRVAGPSARAPTVGHAHFSEGGRDGTRRIAGA